MRHPHRAHPALSLLAPALVAATFAAGCAEPASSTREQLRTLREAAEAGEARFGVPAPLTLAVGWAETRWQLPDVDGDHHHHGMAAPVGVGGLRPWLASDPVGVASDRLGVSRDALADDPALSLLGAAAVLRSLAEARGEVPPADDPGAWLDVLGDYAGLEGEAAQSYGLDVLAWIERGVSATGADGERTVLHSMPLRVPAPEVGASQAYSGAQYSRARWVAAHSSNYSSRSGTRIDRIIIHTTQGSYSGAISWFRNPSANVSAHYVIRSSDGQVTQMVHEGDKAWHVGNYNSRSIGIEHEGFVNDPGRWYTDAMYRSSAALTRYLCNKYNIPIDRSHIIGHSQAPGATHTDPGGGWDWSRYMAFVRGDPERPPFAAEARNQSFPTEMTSGERARAWVSYRNTGSRTWTLNRTRLATAAPRDHASRLYDRPNWINDHRVTAPDHSDYSTGTTGRFTFMIRAPEVTETTTVDETFRLVHGDNWFGTLARVSIVIHPRPPAPPADADEDGAAADVDCDDGDESVHPGAEDACGDGVDSDCDGVDPVCPEPPASDAGVPMSDAGIPSSDAGIPVSDAGPSSGVADAGTSPSGTGPSGMGPSGMGPSGTGPSGTGPSGTGPSGMGPSGMGPSPMEPSGADEVATLSGGCSVSAPAPGHGAAGLLLALVGALAVRRRLTRAS